MSSRKKPVNNKKLESNDGFLKPDAKSSRTPANRNTGRNRSKSNADDSRETPSSTFDRASPMKSAGGHSRVSSRSNRGKSPKSTKQRSTKGSRVGDSKDIFADKSDFENNRNAMKSPGFGREFDDDERLETFGRKDTPGNSIRGDDSREERSKTAYNRHRDENLDVNQRRVPGSHYNNRPGTHKPPPGKGGRPTRPSRGGAGRSGANRPVDRKNSRAGSRFERSDFDESERDRGRGGQRILSSADTRLSDHIDRKLSKKAFKTPDFLQSKAKKEKEWMLDFKSHRSIASPLNKLDEPLADTISYLIIINAVNAIPSENIVLLKQKGTKALVNYSVTLYDQKERDFFGRSYISRPIQLNPTFKDTVNKEFIYIHTASKSQEVCAIVECFLEIITTNEKEKPQYISLGFSVFNLFDDKNKIAQNRLTMYLGSPRFLVTVPFSVFMQNTCTMNIEIKATKDLDILKPYLPSMTLCGMYDLIPGIIGNKMRASASKLQFCGREDIVISGIHIETHHDFERKFMFFLKDFIHSKFKIDTDKDSGATLDRIGRPKISERRIWVDFDNTWKSSGNKTFISLNPPNRDGTYKAIGYAEINDFIIDPKVALTFKMEFRLEMPTSNTKKKEDAFFTIAWAYFLPNYKENGELIPGIIDCNFILGPGASPDGFPLWTPDKRDRNLIDLSLTAEITPRGKFDPKKIDVRVRENPPSIEVDDVYRNRPDSRYDKQRTDLFEEEKIQGNEAVPQSTRPTEPRYSIKSRQDRELEKKYELEQRTVKDKERKISELEQKVKRYQNQLYDKEVDRSKTEKSYDSKANYHERERNRRDLEEKFGHKMDQMKKDYELKMERMEMDYEKKLRSRDERSKSPSQQLPYASSYLADPSRFAPSYYPPDDRGRLIGQSRYVDEDLKILPPPPQVPIQLPTAFDLTRDDEMAFIKLGIKDEILRQDTLDEPELEIECKNPLKASEFTIRFIAFKPPLAMPFGQSVPRRFYFKFHFFTFAETTSEACEIKDPEGRTDLTRELIPGQQYLLEKVGKGRLQDYKSVDSEFLIDSSVSKIYDENIEFYKYLMERELSIDIHDADSHLHYGTCRVNLRALLKQARPGVVRAKDCEIAAFESSNRSITGAVNMGYLQILLSHQGKKESVVDYHDYKDIPEDDNKFLDDRTEREDRKQPSQKKHKFSKKIKSRPIQAINEEYMSTKPDDIYEKVIDDQFNVEDEESEEIRKRMRIERVKKYKFKQQVMHDHETKMRNARRHEEVINVVADPSKPDWIKNQSLRQIETLRDYTKPNVIEKVLKEHIKSLKQLYIVPGTPSFFKYTLKNPFNTKTVFTVNIIDPDKIYLGEAKEFKLVNNYNYEWEFWYSKRVCHEPAFWDMVNRKNEVMLNPGEEVPLLFKFNTFREFNPLKDSSQLYIKERSINIIFEYSSHHEGKGQVFETRLVVTPRNPPIDFSITFHEPPNSHASITIPANFYADPYESYCSDNNVLCEFDAEKRLKAELRTPDLEYNNPKSFLVYIYNDKFNSGLQCVLKIVIHSVMCIYTKSRVGLRMEHTLTMDSDKPRQVMLYSSNSRMIETTGEVVKLHPNSYNALTVSVRTFERDYKTVKINAIDFNTKEMIKSWLMLIESEEPKVTRTEDISLIIDRGVTREIDFTNKLNRETVFELASNRPDLCKPKTTHVKVGPKMTKRIEFYFPPRRIKGKGDCLIFLNDEDYNFYESYRFRLKYIA